MVAIVIESGIKPCKAAKGSKAAKRNDAHAKLTRKVLRRIREKLRAKPATPLPPNTRPVALPEAFRSSAAGLRVIISVRVRKKFHGVSTVLSGEGSAAAFGAALALHRTVHSATGLKDLGINAKAPGRSATRGAPTAVVEITLPQTRSGELKGAPELARLGDSLASCIKLLDGREPHKLAAMGAIVVAPAVVAPIAWGAKVSEAFRDEVRRIATNLGASADHLMAAMAFETGRTFDPKIQNPVSKAIGLIQFMPATAVALGTTTDKLKVMTAVEQLAYVEKYFWPYRGKVAALSDLYMAILWPKAIGRPDTEVIFSHPSAPYQQNKGLDLNGDLKVTKAEAADKPLKHLALGLQPGNVG